MDSQASTRAIDRRARYTQMVIAEAFFSLMRDKGFSKMTVTDICKAAQINRGTFYLHFEDKYALLNALIDEALDADPLIDGAPSSLCQRAPQTDEARLLYQDAATLPQVVARMIERSAPDVVPTIMEETGLTQEEASVVFTYIVHGNLAVNQQLGWQPGAAYRRVQALVTRFAEGGLSAVGRTQDAFAGDGGRTAEEGSL